MSARGEEEPDEDDRDLTWPQRLTFSLPQVGVSMSGMIMSSWLTFFLLPPDDDITAGKVAFIGAAGYAGVQLWGKIVDAVSDPIIGHWSDKTRSRLGRRMPFLLWGTPLFVLSFIALWFPPFPPAVGVVPWYLDANLWYLAAAYTAYWLIFTVVLGPYSALLPEVATTGRGRIVLSSVMGLAGAVGSIFGLLSGEMISHFPDGATLFGVHIPTGIQLVALIGGVSLALCAAPLINVRESPHSAAKDVQMGIWEGVRSATRNPAFLPVVAIAFAFLMASAMIMTVMPYLTTQVLERPPGVEGWVQAGEGEAWMSYLLAIVLLGALCWFPFIHRIAARMGHKNLIILSGAIYGTGMLALPVIGLFPEPTLGAVLVMLILTFPTAVTLVMPPVLFADVIDFDETMTHLRREGLYNGAVAFLTKWSDGIGKAIVVGLLTLGNSRSNPAGIFMATPVAGLAVFLGVGLFAYAYPEERILAGIREYRSQRRATRDATRAAAAPQQ
ncbi:MAG: MFS transporter [Deltaproteobacteria bacterium]|nr:MFS transporter [Deltaproteobacteria bacterium]MCB9786261.1 MFS transporter [Deltaproteobacteria bacterium]